MAYSLIIFVGSGLIVNHPFRFARTPAETDCATNYDFIKNVRLE
ncbi:MAG: hypothetical protein V3T60_13790 [Candidatus Binatia bacterium]